MNTWESRGEGGDGTDSCTSPVKCSRDDNGTVDVVGGGKQKRLLLRPETELPELQGGTSEQRLLKAPAPRHLSPADAPLGPSPALLRRFLTPTLLALSRSNARGSIGQLKRAGGGLWSLGKWFLMSWGRCEDGACPKAINASSNPSPGFLLSVFLRCLYPLQVPIKQGEKTTT